MKNVCESIDRLATVEIRLPYMQRGIVPAFYNAVRAKSAEPISYAIARAIDTGLKQKQNRFGLFTGFYDPDWMPKGESDGPAGAVALAKALESAGAMVTLYVEKEIVAPTVALARSIGVQADCRALSRQHEMANTAIADQLDCAIFTEKCGPTRAGRYHLCTGATRDGLDAPLSGLIKAMKASGKTTCGIGDNGNELGFGKIYDDAQIILAPYARNFRVPAPDGIVCAVETDWLFPCSVSNLGCYAICAALALILRKPTLAHSVQDETTLTQVGIEQELVDGGYGEPGLFVDGLSLRAVCAYLELLKEMVVKYFDSGKRGF